MNKILGLLIVGLMIVGCSENGSYDDDNETNASTITNQTTTDSNETIAYLYSLPTNDMNHPDYTLPDDPGSAGDDTLLGIDSNDNGIRDDVEIYIYNRYKNEPKYRRTLTAIASQHAIATQKTLIDPENGYKNEIYKLEDDAIQCEEYFVIKNTNKLTDKEYLQFSSKYQVYDYKIKDYIFNTKERLISYLKYDQSLSGHIFDSGRSTLQRCTTNIDKLGE